VSQYRVNVIHAIRRLPGGGQRQTSAIWLVETKPADTKTEKRTK